MRQLYEVQFEVLVGDQGSTPMVEYAVGNPDVIKQYYEDYLPAFRKNYTSSCNGTPLPIFVRPYKHIPETDEQLWLVHTYKKGTLDEYVTANKPKATLDTIIHKIRDVTPKSFARLHELITEKKEIDNKKQALEQRLTTIHQEVQG